MGIMTRKQGAEYVISSDCNAADAPTNRAPKGRPSGNYEVWTGENWSAELNNAKPFDTLDAADDYVRANFARVTGLISPQKRSFKRPAKPKMPVEPLPEVTGT